MSPIDVEEVYQRIAHDMGFRLRVAFERDLFTECLTSNYSHEDSPTWRVLWALKMATVHRSINRASIAFDVQEMIDGREERISLTAWVSEERIVIGHTDILKEQGENELWPKHWCCERVM